MSNRREKTHKVKRSHESHRVKNLKRTEKSRTRTNSILSVKVKQFICSIGSFTFTFLIWNHQAPSRSVSRTSITVWSHPWTIYQRNLQRGRPIGNFSYRALSMLKKRKSLFSFYYPHWIFFPKNREFQENSYAAYIVGINMRAVSSPSRWPPRK